MSGSKLIAIGIGRHLKRLFIELFRQAVLQVRHDAICLCPPQRVAVQIPFGMDHFPRLVIQTFTPLDIEVAITQQTLVEGQHQHAAHQGPPHRGEAGRRDLLENRHEKAERSPLVALSAGQVEAVLQILPQLFVKAPLLVAHQKGFGVNPAAGEKRIAVRPASIRFGPAEHHGVEPMPIFEHLLRASEQCRIEELNQHPELEMVALVRRGREKQQVARVAL